MKFRLFLATLAISVVFGSAAPAQAHDDVGVIEVVSATPRDEVAVEYLVSLTYSGDGDPVPAATMTAVAEAADGTTTDPVALVPAGEPGRFVVAVSFPNPGDWNVRFTSVTPRATLEHAQAITAPATSTTTAPTTSTTEAATTDGTIELQPVDATPDDSSVVGTIVLAAVVAALIVLLGLAVFGARRRRS